MMEGLEPGKSNIVVAMSGGVDSSVAAAMLKREGYNVTGVTLQLYDYGMAAGKKGACCAGQDIYDAKSVADKFGFPHYVLDYESAFKEEVIDDFVETYLNGETPIPCIKCNQTVKFRDLMKVAKDLGADALVTGHYVRREMQGGRTEMLRGADKNRDQSYFLFATTREQLEYLRFPLGGMSKSQTRELARELGVNVAEKPDSQDICFVPGGSYASVIERLRPGAMEPGEITHMDGRVLGKHEGVVNYTVGQRRGLGIAWPEPLYVVAVDAAAKRVVVGPEEALKKTVFRVRNVNWISGAPEGVIEAEVKIRSTREPVAANVSVAGGGDSAEITLVTPETAVTPGQACVFYEGERVLGGGWIVKNQL